MSTRTNAAPLSQSAVDAIAKKVSNWGRWGAEDERGALNLITPAQRTAAAALVREGVPVSCALPLAVHPAPDNPRPVQHHMVIAGDVATSNARIPGMQASGDFIGLNPHGWAITHLDALCHVFLNGKMYNGFAKEEVRSDGAQRNSITAGQEGIVSRGVLLDIPGLRGVEWLEPQERISVDELRAAEERAGVRVSEGDILLVSNGRDARRAALGPWAPLEVGIAGLSADCLPWLHERGVAVLGGDAISDVYPSGIDGWPLPIHQIAIVQMGVHLIDNARLDQLTRACRERGRWEFLFIVAPLRLERGTGSPLNPIAMF